MPLTSLWHHMRLRFSKLDRRSRRYLLVSAVLLIVGVAFLAKSLIDGKYVSATIVALAAAAVAAAAHRTFSRGYKNNTVS